MCLRDIAYSLCLSLLSACTSSQAARRDQNRIAQREFRLRKQQRVGILRTRLYNTLIVTIQIRDLEARVELLSGGKDEAMSEMRNILKGVVLFQELPSKAFIMLPDLMQENQTLRNLLRGLSTFIGEGAGGLLPKLGWDMADFTNYVNRSETDTAWESYQLRKNAANASDAVTGQKRPAADDTNGSAKKARSSSDAERESYPLAIGGVIPPITASSLYAVNTESSHEGSRMFGNLMRATTGTSSPIFIQPSPPTASASDFPSNYTSTLNVETSMPPAQFPASTESSAVSSQQTTELSPDQAESDGDPKTNEAIKLIQYAIQIHLCFSVH